MNNRLFSKKHFWVLKDGNHAAIGITDFLQEKLGIIMFLNLPKMGESLSVGENFGDIESKKIVMDLEAPISGKILEVNKALEDDPDLINQEPFESWFVKVKVEFIPDDMMTEEEYKEWIQQPWMQNNH